ncbi:hypothetical protein THII_0003 [Thioploca ingrica]|uniref:Secreted protein n=1 Tax=Thioploca ingrica TaxID=40754 RepID=A0A090AHT9_9GAMM|nr:hypothetical protein THII_0003 [Thioploca ingrica]
MSKVGLTVRWLVVPLSFIAFNTSTMAACEVGNWIPGCPAGVDTTASLGQFAIRLTKEMGENLSPPQNCPGDWTDPNDPCVIWSPVLYDNNTQIGRSDPFIEPVSLESDSVLVCEIGDPLLCNVFDPDPVTDKQMQFPTKDFVEGPTSTEEVHTKIISLNMTDLGQCGSTSANAVRAGSAMTVVPLAKRKRSLGEVESLNTPPGGFPAESFFNMFVEVDLDWDNNGSVDMTVYNPIVPLTVQNLNLTSFPPQVVYIHGGNTNDGAPAVHDVTTGKLIGWIVLAGHGVRGGGKEVSCADLVNFGNEIKGRAKDILKVVPLLVKLSSLTATVQGGEVTLNFETASEKDVLGLQLWRGEPINGECTVDLLNYVNPNMIGEINSVGSETTGATYQLIDNVTQAGTYCYALKEINGNGDAVWIESHIAKAIVN